jgi:anhydro-N-acetylmuramic acid kinase
MISSNKLRVIGIMSGTSLDGIDLVYAEFWLTEKWNFSVGPFQTIAYSRKWKDELQTLQSKDESYISQIDQEYGSLLGAYAHQFIKEHKLEVDAVCSHGHTIFHQPEKKITLQIGDARKIAEECQKTVINDFRSLDVELGGQGAPLVPIGDQLLFSNFDYCLNLGGFSNVSYQKNEKRIAYDICPVNIVLNKLSLKLGFEYDNCGDMASQGIINKPLLNDLNLLNYYSKSAPKSLGVEWVNKYFWPIVDSYTDSTINQLRTCVEHMAQQIGESLNNGKCLSTGGGTFNTFLMARIKNYSKTTIHIPTKDIINYKEALIFGFLGVLKLKDEINCLSSVTGASRDCSSGTILNY